MFGCWLDGYGSARSVSSVLCTGSFLSVSKESLWPYIWLNYHIFSYTLWKNDNNDTLIHPVMGSVDGRAETNPSSVYAEPGILHPHWN